MERFWSVLYRMNEIDLWKNEPNGIYASRHMADIRAELEAHDHPTWGHFVAELWLPEMAKAEPSETLTSAE